MGDYIGDSTRAEIRYARSLGKPVRFTHPAVDPDPVSLPLVPYKLVIPGFERAVTLPAIEPAPGLFVYELPLEHREGDSVANPWRLGHHSGKALAAFPSEDDALRAAREVANLADWTRPADDLRADADFDLERYFLRMEVRTNGLFILGTREGTR
ncbi:hypothetical protein ACFXAW_02830 [Streptomyces sp. NPDC059445]|uniref:hypothetical protein n=1 Tax=Streptomyces sp. NPDC059445 TaxID=3346832 RepID=UPI0036A025F6